MCVRARACVCIMYTCLNVCISVCIFMCVREGGGKRRDEVK